MAMRSCEPESTAAIHQCSYRRRHRLGIRKRIVGKREKLGSTVTSPGCSLRKGCTICSSPSSTACSRQTGCFMKAAFVGRPVTFHRKLLPQPSTQDLSADKD